MARTCLGTPYHHTGRVPGVALDCAGLVIHVMRALRLMPLDFDVLGYAQAPDGQMRARCDEHLVPIARAAMQPGDAVLLITDMEPQHLGILGTYRSGVLSIIHATNARSVVPARVIETRLMFSRSLRFVAAYALPGVEGSGWDS